MRLECNLCCQSYRFPCKRVWGQVHLKRRRRESASGPALIPESLYHSQYPLQGLPSPFSPAAVRESRPLVQTMVGLPEACQKPFGRIPQCQPGIVHDNRCTDRAGYGDRLIRSATLKAFCRLRFIRVSASARSRPRWKWIVQRRDHLPAHVILECEYIVRFRFRVNSEL